MSTHPGVTIIPSASISRAPRPNSLPGGSTAGKHRDARSFGGCPEGGGDTGNVVPWVNLEG